MTFCSSKPLDGEQCQNVIIETVWYVECDSFITKLQHKNTLLRSGLGNSDDEINFERKIFAFLLSWYVFQFQLSFTELLR